ncbi:MAG: hypothetical protein LLG04_14910 [Parachlamydia sp.]|nr:hypothetical protein [Parachlamydia sp.]
MKMYRMIFLLGMVLCPLLLVEAASDESEIARGGARAGGGGRAGVGVGRPGVGVRPGVGAGGAIQRTPSYSRTGAAAVGYRAGVRTGAAASGGYGYPSSYYPTEPYNTTYPGTYPPGQTPYALPNYNPV